MGPENGAYEPQGRHEAIQPVVVCKHGVSRERQENEVRERLMRTVEIGDSVLYQNVGNEVVLLDMSNQTYYGLDSIGADVWKLLMEHRDASEVVERLVALYNVDEHTARQDIDHLVEELLAANLVKLVPATTPATTKDT